MATPFEFNVDEQVKLIGTWQDFLAAANDAANPLHDVAVQVLLALNKRNYDKLPAGAPKGALTEAQIGANRRAAFDSAAANYASHTQALSSNEVAFNKAFVPARDFLRGIHRSVAAIARDEDVPALAGLPLLGEVSVPAKMFRSAATLVTFLKKNAALKSSV